MILEIPPGHHIEVHENTIVIMAKQEDGRLAMEWAGQVGDKFQIKYVDETEWAWHMYVELFEIETTFIYLKVIYDGGNPTTEAEDVIGFTLGKFFDLTKGCPIPNM